MDMSNNSNGATPGNFHAGQQNKDQQNGQPAMNIDPALVPPMVTPLQNLGTTAAHIDCPYCKAPAQTKVAKIKQDPENCGIIACLTCLICCPLLICLPMILKGKEEWHHRCSNCQNKVAIRYADGRVQVLEPANGKLVPSQYTSPAPLVAPPPAAPPAAPPAIHQPAPPYSSQPTQ